MTRPVALAVCLSSYGLSPMARQELMRLSARTSRQLGEIVDKIEDREELNQMRMQTKKIQVKSLIAGLLMTLIVLLIL